tara:strand:- start:613 stop:2001 length:1389 start_codon:yes stop_codon:yes gene_type:complete
MKSKKKTRHIKKRNKTIRKKKYVIIKKNTDLSLLSLKESVNMDIKSPLNSFSPEINKQIIKNLKSQEKKNILDSLFQCNFVGTQGNINELWKLMEVSGPKTLKLSLNNNKCLEWSSPPIIKEMLKLLFADNKINEKEIISPKQISSNCWFNCGFMNNFISDKGRKFWKIFRYFMIIGKLPEISNTKTKSNSKNSLFFNLVSNDKIPKLHTQLPINLYFQFFLMNLSIEAVLKGNKLSLMLDTNDIIKGISRELDKEKYKRNWIVSVHKAGNPRKYFDEIFNYFLPNHGISQISIYLDLKSETSTTIQEEVEKYFHSLNKNKNQLQKIDKLRLKRIEYSNYKVSHIPDIITVIILDEAISKKKIPKKLMKININGITYKLDSILSIDTLGKHFCSFLTINNKFMAFDGESFSKLTEFNWPIFINKNINIFFEGTFLNSNSSSLKQLKWNFMKCYQELNYYRLS